MFSSQLHHPAHLMLVSLDVSTGHLATSEATVNKIVFTKRGKVGNDLWTLNVGESLIFLLFPVDINGKKKRIYDV